MIRFPRTLVITSCSDLKTRPRGTTDTRSLQKRIRELGRELRRKEANLPDPKGAAGDAECQALVSELSSLRTQLRTHMLLEEDFQDPQHLAVREAELKEHTCLAWEMYAGPHHEDVVYGVRRLREQFGPGCVDLKIISAGYGLLDEHTEIAPYDLTFSGMDAHQLDEWASRLNIHSDVASAITGYDLVIFLLGKEYLRSVRLPLPYDHTRQRLLFVASASSKPFLNYDDHYGLAMVGNREVHDFGTAAVSLKGRVFRLFAEAVAHSGWQLVKYVHERPQAFMEAIAGARKAQDQTVPGPANKQLQFFEERPEAPNPGFPMTFFMPENEDRVDPDFDPWTLATEPRVTTPGQRTDKYSHELHRHAPYDGILISLHEISQWPAVRRDEIYTRGAREYFNFPTGPLLGDCGAFTFNDQGEPPFTGAEVLERYRQLGVDMGVSVDYIIFPDMWQKDATEAERRFGKNLEEAQRFWDAWLEAKAECPDWAFTPIGVAQGGEPQKFARAVEKLQEIGYRYIALGGLARSTSAVIEECLKAVKPVLRPDVQLHLFGFAKLELANRFRDLGVTSFDSTSPLVQGFMRGVYWDPHVPGEAYSFKQHLAIRLPFSGGRTAEKKGQGRVNREDSLILETAALQALRQYGDSPSEGTYAAARDALVNYSNYLQPWPYDPNLWDSIETLRARPWERCSCEICQKWGIAVALLRSNNHNRRRGFHNTWVFYHEKLNRVGHGM